jgi:hypothetical protein
MPDASPSISEILFERAQMWMYNLEALTDKTSENARFNGHCGHAGAVNQTHGARRSILAHYLHASSPRRADRRQHLSSDQRFLRAGWHPRHRPQSSHFRYSLLWRLSIAAIRWKHCIMESASHNGTTNQASPTHER